MSLSKIRIRHNLSVPDLKDYYKQVWYGGHGSVSTSLALGQFTDMEFYGRTQEDDDKLKLGSIKLHKAVVMHICPFLWTMMLNVPEFEAKLVFPDISLEVIKAFVDLIYHGECKLSSKCDVHAIMNFSHILGLMIPPERFQVTDAEVKALSKAPSKCVSIKVPVSSQLTGNDENRNKGLPETKAVKEGVIDLSGFDFEDQCSGGVEKTGEDLIKMTLRCASESDPSVVASKQRYPATHFITSPGKALHLASMKSSINKQSKAKKSTLKLSCQHCQFKCYHYVRLIKHCNSLHPNSTFVCDKCSFQTSKIVQLQRHNREVHLGKGDIICSICGFKALNNQKLESHMRYLHTIKTKKMFKRIGKTKVNTQTRLKSEGSRKSSRCRSLQLKEALECSLCEYSTIDFEALREHSKTVH